MNKELFLKTVRQQYGTITCYCEKLGISLQYLYQTISQPNITRKAENKLCSPLKLTKKLHREIFTEGE